MALDLASEYLFLDGVQEVDLERPAGSAIAAGVKALWRSASPAEIADLGLAADASKFQLWKDTLGGQSPQTGDRIVDAAGKNYDVVLVELQCLGSRFRCYVTPA